jgi:hypothetical protein
MLGYLKIKNKNKALLTFVLRKYSTEVNPP